MIRITEMEERHLDALAEVERACFAHPWSREGLAAELSSPTALFLTAEEETGAVAGYVGSHLVCGECYIDNVAVLPEQRRRGTASALLEELIRRVKAQGGAFLTLEVRESNALALALYGKLGFAPAGRRKDFYTGPREDALLLTLYL